MEFDFAKTISLIKGGLLDHQETWKNYLEENADWQKTATVLTGPLILVNIVLTVIVSRIIGGFSYYGYYGNIFTALFWGLVMAAVGFIIAVFVFNFLAGHFKGESNFSRAFAAVSLAAIPAWVAGVVGAFIPYIGWLISLAGGISDGCPMAAMRPPETAMLARKRPPGVHTSPFSMIRSTGFMLTSEPHQGVRILYF